MLVKLLAPFEYLGDLDDFMHTDKALAGYQARQHFGYLLNPLPVADECHKPCQYNYEPDNPLFQIGKCFFLMGPEARSFHLLMAFSMMNFNAVTRQCTEKWESLCDEYHSYLCDATKVLLRECMTAYLFQRVFWPLSERYQFQTHAYLKSLCLQVEAFFAREELVDRGQYFASGVIELLLPAMLLSRASMVAELTFDRQARQEFFVAYEKAIRRIKAEFWVPGVEGPSADYFTLLRRVLSPSCNIEYLADVTDLLMMCAKPAT